MAKRILICGSIMSCVAGVLLFVATGRLEAQATGSISGTVTDSSGAAIPEASVQVRNVSTTISRSIVTDGQGRYRAPELEIGGYEISVTKQGFTSIVQTGITLTVGAQPVVDVQLTVGQQTQTVTVAAEASQVETESTALGVLVDSTQVHDLPLNGRNYTQLIALNPGVTQMPQGAPGQTNVLYGQGTRYSISGSRPSGQNYLLDGTDMNDFWNNGPGAASLGTQLGIEAIAEFQALTNTYSVQYGGNGAVINASSRSGTNELHGSLYEFLRNNVIEARNFYDIAKPPFHQNQFGASLGGPIKKNKAFFFVNYEGLRSAEILTSEYVVPDAAAHNFMLPNSAGVETPVTQNSSPSVRQAIANTLALYPLPSIPILTPAGLPTGTGYALTNYFANGSENYILGRVDYTFSEKDFLFVRYILDHANYNHDGGDSAIMPFWPDLETTRSHYATVEERHILSPTLVNVARTDYTRPNENANAYGSPVVTNGVPSQGTCSTTCSPGTHPLQFTPGRDDGIVSVGSGVNQLGPSGALPFYLIQNKFTFADDIIWTSGSHSIKAGAMARRFRDNTWLPQRLLTWTFGSLTNFLDGLPQQISGYFDPQQNPSFDPYKDFRYWAFGFYVEDQWKVTPKLTLNLGLRYEPTTRIEMVNHQMYALIDPPFGAWVPTQYGTASNPSLRNWDPRVGLAWDPFADHKTSIRAGFGMFYDVIYSRQLVEWFQPPLIALTETAAQGLTYPVPFGNVPAGTGLVIPTNGTLSVSTGSEYPINNTPYQMQWNFNIQRELFPSSVLTVGYIGSHSVHLFEQYDLNSPVPFIGANGFQTFGVLNAAGTAVVANPRINPAYSALSLIAPIAYSNYNALQTSFTHRFAKGWQSQVSYTWSKSIDTGSGSFGVDGGSAATNPFDFGIDRGLSNFNRKNNFRVSGLYTLPFTANGAIGKFVEGWQVTGIYTYLSGFPFSPASAPFIAQNSAGSTSGRPNLVLGCQLYPQNQTLLNWFNPNCFSLQSAGTYGNAGRDIIIGPNLWDMDASLIKDTRLTERFTLQFRAEVFNLLNHPSFQNPSSSIFSSIAGARVGSAGQISATDSQPRQIQFALKVLF